MTPNMLQKCTQVTSDLQEHQIQLARSEHFVTHDAVRVFLHALLLGEAEKLPSHETEQVELLRVRLQVDTDALAARNTSPNEDTASHQKNINTMLRAALERGCQR